MQPRSAPFGADGREVRDNGARRATPLPTRADAVRFLTDPETSPEQLQRACALLGLSDGGPPDDLRARALEHVERAAADAEIVCLNPAPDALSVVRAFNDAFNRHDVDAIMALMTDDCVFENTRPAPDGTRYEGQPAVRAFWEQFFTSSPQARFEFGDMFAAGGRCVVCWTYSWVKNDLPGRVRGVDLFRIRDGKIAEKLSFVKG
jgi:ketosteroid isomerase-like protein